MQSLVHVARWKMPDGRLRWAAATPFENRKFTDLIKQRIPPRCRAWKEEVGCWQVDESLGDDLRSLLVWTFAPETLCPRCWDSGWCPKWDEVSWRANGLALGWPCKAEAVPRKDEPLPRQDTSKRAVPSTPEGQKPTPRQRKPKPEPKASPPPKPQRPLPPALLTAPQAAALLGVRLAATTEEIKRAARALSFKAHPDRGGSHELMIRVNAARDLLLRLAQRRTG